MVDDDQQLKELISLKKSFLNSKSLSAEEQATYLSESFNTIYDAVTNNKVTITYRTNACDSLSIWFTRSLQLLTKYPQYKSKFTTLLIEEKCIFLFHYVIDFWNDSGAALGNALKEVFIKMISYLTPILNEEVRNKMFKNWLLIVLELPYTMRAFYFMIEQLHKYVKPVDFILQAKPNFILDCLNNIWSKALCSIVGKCTFLVLKYNYSKASESEWLLLWKNQVISCLKNVELRKGIESYLLPNLFQISKTATIEFLKTVIELNSIPILISTLKVAQDAALLIEPFMELDPTTGKPLLDIKEISTLLKVNEASYRIGAFQLLVSSPKNSRPIQPCVYENIINSLDMIFSDPDLETRNEISSYFKKFISRIKESTYASNRDAVSLTNKNFEKFELEIKEKLENTEQGRIFLTELIKYIENNLRPGSSYLRKEMAYKLLVALIKSGLDSRIEQEFIENSKSVKFVFSIDIYNPVLIRLVIDNLMDNFEDIRHFSTEIISMSPFKLDDIVDMRLLETRALDMLCDIKGKEVDSGARFFKFSFNYYQNENNMKKCEEIIKLLLSKINHAITKANEDFSVACVDYSIQGYFAAFKFIFEIMNFSKCSLILESNDVFNKLFNYSNDIWQIVKKVLQHDSPEGILLDGFQDTYTEEMEEKYGKATQIISSYSWRSIKESSSMMDSLLKLKKASPIDDELILKIGPLISEQLATIRHRGAFSSVYPVFISCCSLCTFREKISKQPENWLDENLKLIESRSKYITRRSAGIPFLITAILSSNKNLIKPTFYKLLEIAKLPVGEENAVLDNINLPQVNAFNCIKVIFIDSTLSEESIYYVDEAFILTLNSFTSKIWTIRNCAVMLFTALQNRLFSSKKVKANYLPSYPARLFFEKFDKIHELFFYTLKDVSLNGVKNQIEIEKIFPILTIISRLEPTPGYNGMNTFIPIIIELLENKIWKVREMSARSLPSMINSFERFSIIIIQLMDNVDKSTNLNKMHGSLLAIKETIVKFMLLSTKESENIINKLLTNDNQLRITILSKLDLILSDINCHPIKMTYFQILQLLKLNSDNKIIAKLTAWFYENNKLDDQLDGSKQLTLKELSNILIEFLNNDETFIENCMNSSLYEIQLGCISFYNNKLEEGDISIDIKTLLIHNIWKILKITTIWKYVKSQALRLLKNLIIKSDNLESNDVESLNNHTLELLEILESEYNEDIRLSIVETLGSYISKLIVFSEEKYIGMFNKWVDIVRNMVSDDLEYVIRLSAMKSLIAFNEIYSKNGKNEIIQLQIQAFIFEFLTDDDENICHLASQHLSKFVLNQDDKIILPIIVEKLMIDYFVKNSGKPNVFDILINYNGFNFFDSETKFIDMTAGDLLLFSIEKSNLERNPTDKMKELIKIINTTKVNKNEVNFESLITHLRGNIDDITKYLVHNRTIDGCFGLLSNEKIFDFVYCQLILYTCLKSNNLIDFEINELTEYLVQSNIHCHPLILETL